MHIGPTTDASSVHLNPVMEYAGYSVKILRYGQNWYLPGSCPRTVSMCPCSCPVPSYFHPSKLKPIHLFTFTSVSVNLSILSAAAQFLDSSYPDISIEFDSSIYLDPLYLIPHTAIFCTNTTRLKFQRSVLSFISIPTVCLKGGSMHSQNHTYFDFVSQ